MAERGIQIIIPACNNVNELDVTMESIRKQNFDPENVYVTIIDFASEDGTYEKAMSYDGKHLGVYARPFQKNKRQQLADAARILRFLGAGGLYSFSAVLYPGDIMYPDCLSVLSDQYIENYGLNPSLVFCESDLFTEDGMVEKQKPLFSEDCVIDGSREVREYVKRGYKHQIFQVTLALNIVRRKSGYETNEGRCFNKLANRCLDRMAVYVREPLVCTKRIVYEDELQEILYRWEAAISMERYYSNSRGHSFDENFVQLASENLAEYALWRSFCLYQKKGDFKAAEDCFLISKVISAGVEKKEVYQNMKRLLAEKDSAIEKALEQYFLERD